MSPFPCSHSLRSEEEKHSSSPSLLALKPERRAQRRTALYLCPYLNRSKERNAPLSNLVVLGKDETSEQIAFVYPCSYSIRQTEANGSLLSGLIANPVAYATTHVRPDR